MMQTDATLLANNKQYCWAQHVASVCMEPQQCWHLLALVAYNLKSDGQTFRPTQTDAILFRGGCRKLKKGGGGTPILERGDRKTAFERSFQCFSCKSFAKFSRKAEDAAPPAPPLNPRMLLANNTQQCCDLLCPFAWALSWKVAIWKTMCRVFNSKENKYF